MFDNKIILVNECIASDETVLDIQDLGVMSSKTVSYLKCPYHTRNIAK